MPTPHNPAYCDICADWSDRTDEDGYYVNETTMAPEHAHFPALPENSLPPLITIDTESALLQPPPPGQMYWYDAQYFPSDFTVAPKQEEFNMPPSGWVPPTPESRYVSPEDERYGEVILPTYVTGEVPQVGDIVRARKNHDSSLDHSLEPHVVVSVGPLSQNGRSRIVEAKMLDRPNLGWQRIEQYAGYYVLLSRGHNRPLPQFESSFWSRNSKPWRAFGSGSGAMGEVTYSSVCATPGCGHVLSSHHNSRVAPDLQDAAADRCTTCESRPHGSNLPQCRTFKLKRRTVVDPQVKTKWCECAVCDIRFAWLKNEADVNAAYERQTMISAYGRLRDGDITPPPEVGPIPTCATCSKFNVEAMSPAQVSWLYFAKELPNLWRYGANTLLHHIELSTIKERVRMWKIPAQNSGETPTHMSCSCVACPSCTQRYDPLRSGARCARGHHRAEGCGACVCVICPSCNVNRGVGVSLGEACTQDGCGRQRGCCCACAFCSGCGGVQTGNINRCSTCRLCPTCCAARGGLGTSYSCWPTKANEETMRTPIFQKGSLKKWKATKDWKGAIKEENPIPRYIGLEIECANGGRPNMTRVVVQKWTGNIVSDGSIHDECGFELNLAPAMGDQFLAQLKDVTDEMKRTGVKVNNQCGIHVHVDVSDFNIWDMRKLILLYKKVEPAMFAVLAERRTGNRYCVPCGDKWWQIFTDPGKTAELKTKLISALYGPDKVAQKGDSMAIRKEKALTLKNDQKVKDNNLRYRALNVHSWFLRGTLEFRHAESMTDYNAIRNWALTCAGIVEAANSMSQKEIEELGGSPLSILRYCAPTTTVSRWLKNRYDEARGGTDEAEEAPINTLTNTPAEPRRRRNS